MMNELGLGNLINLVSERTGYTKGDVEVVIREVFHVIMETLIRGDKVVIPHFGTFTLIKKEPRECVDPRTGKKTMSNFKAVIKFTQARRMKSQLADLTNPELDW